MTGEANRAPDEGSTSVLRFGPFRVSTGRKEIEAFRRETGWSQVHGDIQVLDAIVPHTFPMSWLGLPQMHAAIEAQLKAACGIAIHESQSFAYASQLEADQNYVMDAEIDRQENPRRLILRVTISKQMQEPGLQQTPLLAMETILRIVAAAETMS
jgi:hypothetical protein